MAQTTVTHNNFTSGEIAPDIWGRVDTDFYKHGAKELENFHATFAGGITRRVGTFAHHQFGPDLHTLMIPFVFNNDQSYIIVPQETPQSWTVTGSDGTFIAEIEGSGDLTVWGEVGGVLDAAFFKELRYSQAYDTMIITSRYSHPKKIIRNSHASWSMSNVTFEVPPTTETIGLKVASSLTLSSATTGDITVTCASALFLEGDVGRTITQKASTGSFVVSNLATDIITLTLDDLTLPNLAQVSVWSSDTLPSPLVESTTYYYGTSGGKKLYATRVAAVNGTPSVDLTNIGVGTHYFREEVTGVLDIETVVAGEITTGTVVEDFFSSGSHTTLIVGNRYLLGGTPSSSIKLTAPTFSSDWRPNRNKKNKTAWLSSEVPTFRSGDVGSYILVATGGVFEIIGYTNSSRVLVRVKVRQDEGKVKYAGEWTLESKLWFVDGDSQLVVNSNNYPLTSSFSDQRLYFASWDSNAQGIVGSVVGDYFTFSRGDEDSDSLSFTITSPQRIKHLVPTSPMMVLTEGSEVTIDGGNESLITATSVQVKTRSYNGCSYIQPVIVNGSACYVSASRRRVHLSRYNKDTGQYATVDLLKFATHITKTATIIGLTYQPEPYPLITITLDDGTLAQCTYNEEESITAWSRIQLANTATDTNMDARGYAWCFDAKAIPNGQDYRLFMLASKTSTNAEGNTQLFSQDFSGLVGSTTNPVCFTDFTVVIPNGTYANQTAMQNAVDAATVNSGNESLFMWGDGEDYAGLIYTANTVIGKADNAGIYPLVVAQATYLGFEYESTADLLVVENNVGLGSSQISHLHSNLLSFRVYDTMDFKFNGDYVSRQVTNIPYGFPNTAVTDDLYIPNYKWARGGHDMTITQDQPVPTSIAAIFTRLTVNQ